MLNKNGLELIGLGAILEKLPFLPQVTIKNSKGKVSVGDIGEMVDFKKSARGEDCLFTIYFGLKDKPIYYKLATNELTLTENNKSFINNCCKQCFN